MLYNDFKNVLDAVREIDKFIDQAQKLGIDMVDSPLFDNLSVLLKVSMTEAYTENGYDWVSWYLYELPMLKQHRKEGEKEEYAWDENKKPIDMSSDEALWKYLEKEYKVKKE